MVPEMAIDEVRLIELADVIVGTIFEERFEWFVSPKELWLLDSKEDMDLMMGYVDTGEVDIGEYDRFDMPIVDETNAGRFLREMSEYRVDTLALARLVAEYLAAGFQAIEIWFLAPLLFVDFDRRRLISAFPEPTGFDYYVPTGWVGEWVDEFDSLVDKVPETKRYWVIDGEPVFEGHL